MNKEKIINGINIKQLFEIISAVKKKPALAKFQFRVKNTWMKGSNSRSVIKEFYGAEKEDNTRTSPFILENDFPVTLLGSNEGPAPVEYVLNALAACVTSSIVYQAAAKEIILDDVESELTGNFDLHRFLGIQSTDGNNNENLKLTIRIEAQNLSNEGRKFLTDLGKKSSPVYNMITNSFPVSVSIENEPCDD